MGLKPRNPQEYPQYDWDFLESLLSDQLSKPGSSIYISPDSYKMNREEIFEELIKNQYKVDRTNEENWLVS